MTNTDTRGSRGSNTLAYANKPPGCMHEPSCKRDKAKSEENSYRFEENTRVRGTVSIRICQRQNKERKNLSVLVSQTIIHHEYLHLVIPAGSDQNLQ